MITIFEPFGDTSTYAGVNRSISIDSSKIATVDNNGAHSYGNTVINITGGLR